MVAFSCCGTFFQVLEAAGDGVEDAALDEDPVLDAGQPDRESEMLAVAAINVFC